MMAEQRITSGNNCPLKVTRVRASAWTETKRRRFLNALATSCNVQQSARSIGMTKNGAYALRGRDAGFAAAWSEAMQMGAVRLEEVLLENALAAAERLTREGPLSFDETAEPIDEAPAQPLTADEIRLMLFLLTRHADGHKGLRHIGGRAHRATREETNAVLKRKLDSLDRRIKAVT
ncbi:hypothetical protein [Sphingomonas qomolangmaensis]|uniref:Terminase small subunit n=1 Tax=Sphingomonas qomolangmaensis TaxID=2918765 RepID=A0ABY5L835_9SPHN|nr:hypothetical protein [Sphingomonas qomolangmaensis]UUL82106.1 hypothetical protein NMP03_13060 [Sphingomonas qomolangmaensis]